MSSLEDYILRTDKDPVSWEFYKKQEACDWSAEEFRFTKDKDDYLDSPKRIQDLLKDIFGFFLVGDGLISEDLLVLIQEALKEKNWPKVMYLSMQLKVENTHAETYSKAALTIVPDSEHKDMIEMCKNLDCVRDKGEWIQKFIDSQESKALRNVGCACGEGVFFVGLFSIIFYFKRLNKFKDFIESNEQISKDESIHRDEKASEAKRSLVSGERERAVEIIKSAVELEKNHTRYLLREPIISEEADREAGMTIENLEKYIEMLGDQVAVLCGLDIIYETKVNLPWMEDINLSQKTNFYERNVVGSYRKFNPETALNGEGEGDPLANPEDEDF
jgi:ribonucleoside-diphosphate reductase beta chain